MKSQAVTLGLAPSLPASEESALDSSKEAGALGRQTNPPIAILGIPFDNITISRALERIAEMVESRRPHYLVTANVDFLVQAQTDIELRRILFDAHLVLCDGTPLVWASRLLGNPLPERVAGADLVPLLIRVAAQRGYRLFLLGATPESAQRAVTNLYRQHPDLIIAGHYSPPFNKLLEMDHDEIKRRITEAAPDLLLISFGCPKQEKWIAMHYRSLGVPVAVGVGATIDFLAGQVFYGGKLGAALADITAAVDEYHVAEIDLLLARQRVRRRAALDVDCAPGRRRYAGFDVDLDPFDFELGKAQLLALHLGRLKDQGRIRPDSGR